MSAIILISLNNTFYNSRHNFTSSAYFFFQKLLRLSLEGIVQTGFLKELNWTFYKKYYSAQEMLQNTILSFIVTNHNENIRLGNKRYTPPYLFYKHSIKKPDFLNAKLFGKLIFLPILFCMCIKVLLPIPSIK